MSILLLIMIRKLLFSNNQPLYLILLALLNGFITSIMKNSKYKINYHSSLLSLLLKNSFLIPFIHPCNLKPLYLTCLVLFSKLILFSEKEWLLREDLVLIISLKDLHKNIKSLSSLMMILCSSLQLSNILILDNPSLWGPLVSKAWFGQMDTILRIFLTWIVTQKVLL